MKHFNPRAPLQPGARTGFGPDARNGLRLSVELEATLSGSRVGRQSVELWDISLSGCRIACVSNYPVETPVIITIPGLSPIGAQVRWSDLAFCGLRFNAPLHPFTVERIAAHARAQP